MALTLNPCLGFDRQAAPGAADQHGGVPGGGHLSSTGGGDGEPARRRLRDGQSRSAQGSRSGEPQMWDDTLAMRPDRVNRQTSIAAG